MKNPKIGRDSSNMKAMVIHKICDLEIEKEPLRKIKLPIPLPSCDEILIKVTACGVCHTELDEIEGRIPPAKYPMIPGHQVVGVVQEIGSRAEQFRLGDRVGVAWIFDSCGYCDFCLRGLENLCPEFKATGRDVPGGYAEYMVAPWASAYLIPEGFSDVEAAPLLCAGAIGYRSIRLANITDGMLLGLMGFGASAHLMLKMAKYAYPKMRVFVFARSDAERSFARDLGADWAGDTCEDSPVPLNSIIDTTPAWRPIVHSLLNLEKGGRLVINAIRKEPRDMRSLLDLDYSSHLWLEKEIKSVANVTRADVREFLALASAAGIRPEVDVFDLESANEALIQLKRRKIRGAKVLRIV
jgi:alcohol dehydrogenase, propanol-preferring